MEFALIKLPGGTLKAANESDHEQLSKIKNGRYVTATIIQVRNPEFHKKFFALLNFGFDYFEPTIEPVKGLIPAKSFERFRKDVLIMAGHHDVVVNIKSEVRYEAKSISFGSMDEAEFSELYKSVFNVLWTMVLSKVQGMTEETAENTINQLLEFNS